MKENEITSFIASSKLDIKREEINKLQKLGYVILKRNTAFWKKQGVDLDMVRDTVETEILLSKHSNFSNKDDETYRYEEGTNRLSNILAKNPIFNPFIAVPDIVYCAKEVLGENFQLSSLGVREPLKNSGHQGLHLDWKQRKNLNSSFYQLTCFVLLDDVTKDNGPPRIIPKSHINFINVKSTSRIENKRYKDDHKILQNADKNSLLLCGKTGDIIIINVNAFHGGTKNISGKRRRLIHIDYRQRSERPQVNHFYAIPKKLHKLYKSQEIFLLSLKKPSKYQGLRRLIYNYRNNLFIKFMLRVRSFFI